MLSFFYGWIGWSCILYWWIKVLSMIGFHLTPKSVVCGIGISEKVLLLFDFIHHHFFCFLIVSNSRISLCNCLHNYDTDKNLVTYFQLPREHVITLFVGQTCKSLRGLFCFQPVPRTVLTEHQTNWPQSFTFRHRCGRFVYFMRVHFISSTGVIGIGLRGSIRVWEFSPWDLNNKLRCSNRTGGFSINQFHTTVWLKNRL